MNAYSTNVVIGVCASAALLSLISFLVSFYLDNILRNTSNNKVKVQRDLEVSISQYGNNLNSILMTNFEIPHREEKQNTLYNNQRRVMINRWKHQYLRNECRNRVFRYQIRREVELRYRNKDMFRRMMSDRKIQPRRSDPPPPVKLSEIIRFNPSYINLFNQLLDMASVCRERGQEYAASKLEKCVETIRKKK